MTDGEREAERRITEAVASGATKLDLSGLGLRTLPDAVEQLTTLRSLNVANNQLTTVPAAVWQLTALQTLNVIGNQIAKLPEAMEQLTALEALYVAYNQLEALPEAVWQLKALQDLDIDYNMLGTLPEAVGQLKLLQELSVSGNQLVILPPSLGQLMALQTLHVSHNLLTTLPDSLAHCTRLTKLDVSHNVLTDLPDWLDRLPLDELWLQANPGLRLSESVTGPYVPSYERLRKSRRIDPRVILEAFAESRGRDAQPLNEVKLVLVGRGAAGKTSIGRRLIKGTFSRTQRETQGIDITPWPLRCGDREVRVNVWDFAGQVITHATHQFFLSESSIYVLVLTGREDTQKIDAEYWLRLVRAFAADGQGRVSPVIVALNKFDDHPFTVDRRLLQEKYPFIVGFVETDCKSGRGIETLKETLGRTVGELPIVTQPFKRKWWNIRQVLQRAQRRRHYMPYDDFRTICAEAGETEETRQRFLADVFHALGVALNYGRDERLRDSTVLNPRWVTEGIYKLLREAVPDDGSGLLTMERVAAVLPDEPEKMRRYLVDLMRRFDLAFPLADDGDRWLVPQRLPAEQPDLGEHWTEPEEATRLRYRYAVIPEGLLPRFVARTYPLSETGDGDARHALPRWRGGVVLADGDARALVRVDTEERRIDVTATGPATARLELLGVIRADFRTIHDDIRGLGAIEEMEVEGSPGHYVPESTLRADEERRSESAVATPEGTVTLDPRTELNRFSEPQARDAMAWRPRVFISYTTHDVRQKDELLVRLKPLKETYGLLDTWDDGVTLAGTDWDSEVRVELEAADVVLLLVSARFRASDYVRGVEVRRAVERARAGECVVVPIILERLDDWTSEPFGRFNAIPRKGKPVRDFRPSRDGWNEVGKELRTLLQQMVSERARRGPWDDDRVTALRAGRRRRA